VDPVFLELWQDYWWLIFPIGAGVIGISSGIGKAWERNAKRRHRQRLEILQAKSAIKAASRPAVVAAASDATESHASQLAKLFATHDAVTARWLDYELDVAKLIAFPAMSDGRQPLTAAFLRAQRIADGLRPASPKARVTPDQLSEYRNAVVDYEVAFDVAERDARRLKDSTFTETERKRLDKAKQLLSIAIDQAATPAERQVAYRRVREELDGLIALSDDAIEVLETQVALELAPGSEETDAAPATPTTAPAAENPPPSTTPPPPPSADPWPVPARKPHAPGIRRDPAS
jgi:hypothetical protein